VGVVTGMYLLKMAEITTGSSFEPNNLTELKLGYFLRVPESEMTQEKYLDPEELNVTMLV